MSTQKKKQKAFYLFYIIAGIFCAISTGWTKVNNDITSYLPDTSETRVGLDMMNDQFVTYGSGSIMLDNVTFEKAEQIASELEEIDGVTSVQVMVTLDCTSERVFAEEVKSSSSGDSPTLEQLAAPVF